MKKEKTKFGQLKEGDFFQTDSGHKYMKIKNSEDGETTNCISVETFTTYHKDDDLDVIHCIISKKSFASDIAAEDDDFNDTRFSILQNLQKLADAYYALNVIDEEFWYGMQATSCYDNLMSNAWKRVNWSALGEAIDTSLMLTIGAYVDSKKFNQMLFDSFVSKEDSHSNESEAE